MALPFTPHNLDLQPLEVSLPLQGAGGEIHDLLARRSLAQPASADEGECRLRLEPWGDRWLHCG